VASLMCCGPWYSFFGHGFKSTDLMGLMVVVLMKEILLNHVAVECDDQASADLFFTTILGLPKTKSSLLSKELSNTIFQIDEPVAFHMYDNGKTRIEVFIHRSKQKRTYTHVCIQVDDKTDFIASCKQHGIEPLLVEKDKKQLLFVRDFSGNLFEVVEK
jgi:catechol 2,3-dioxygenase-like lactoylglutathione lyase family enzyme